MSAPPGGSGRGRERERAAAGSQQLSMTVYASHLTLRITLFTIYTLYKEYPGYVSITTRTAMIKQLVGVLFALNTSQTMGVFP